MTNTISAYPLTWPAGWPRTDKAARRYGKFATKHVPAGSNWSRTKDVTVSQALSRIDDELRAFDGPSRDWTRIDPNKTIISTNLALRLDGMPRSDQREPADPGAALYFEMEGKRQCVPCDAYTTVAQNLAAIAATLSALRALERHGSGLMERAFTGFTALPSSIVTPCHWRDVLDYHGHSLAEAKQQWRRLMTEHHPDKTGGDGTRAAEINAAWERAQEEL